MSPSVSCLDAAPVAVGVVQAESTSSAPSTVASAGVVVPDASGAQLGENSTASREILGLAGGLLYSMQGAQIIKLLRLGIPPVTQD